MRRALVLAIVAGCYQPELRDCTVTCSGPDECADGQVCGSDGMCAAPDVAGQCAPGGGSATAKVSLRVTIDGHGDVLVDGRTTCVSDEDAHDGCTYTFATGTTVELHAHALDEDKGFDRWTGGCAGQSASCTLVMAAATTVGARFR